MKKYKQFRAEQQYITEVGPFASAMMAAMGIFGAGYAGFKLFKKAKEGIKGYRESKAEKKANRESGVEIPVKKINPDTGEEYEELVTLTGSKANLDADGVEKKRKELQKKYDTMEKGKHKATANAKIRKELGKEPGDIITKDDKKKGMDLLKKAQEPETPPEDDNSAIASQAPKQVSPESTTTLSAKTDIVLPTSTLSTTKHKLASIIVAIGNRGKPELLYPEYSFIPLFGLIRFSKSLLPINIRLLHLVHFIPVELSL